MMATYATIAAQAADQYLAAISQTQENFLKAMEMSMAWAPPVRVPAAPVGDFPTPEEMIGVSFGFAQKLLKQQQDFAERLIAATEARTETVTPKSTASPKSKSSAATN
jgi:hypothetical protein